MDHNGLKSSRRASRRRVAPAAAAQYSLFGTSPAAPDADVRHFARQAQLCQRLLSGLHQPDLVEQLARLQEEYEAKASPAAPVRSSDPALS
jgi:hypothetical protein